MEEKVGETEREDWIDVDVTGYPSSHILSLSGKVKGLWDAVQSVSFYISVTHNSYSLNNRFSYLHSCFFDHQTS